MWYCIHKYANWIWTISSIKYSIVLTQSAAKSLLKWYTKISCKWDINDILKNMIHLVDLYMDHHTFIMMICSGLWTDCPASVWGREWTTCLLCGGPGIFCWWFVFMFVHLHYPSFACNFSSHMILFWNCFLILSTLYCNIPKTHSLLFLIWGVIFQFYYVQTYLDCSDPWWRHQMEHFRSYRPYMRGIHR